MTDPTRDALGAIVEILRNHKATEANVLDRIEDIATDALADLEPTPGCDCTKLCSMGPTCPGGILAGLSDGCADEDQPTRVHVTRAQATAAQAVAKRMEARDEEVPAPVQRIAAAVERSSFGTPEAKAARASVSDERAREVVARSKEIGGETPRRRPVSEMERLRRAVAASWNAEFDANALASSPSRPHVADALEALAVAIYADGKAPEWLTTIDGSPNAAAYELAARVLAVSRIAPLGALADEFRDRAAAAHAESGQADEPKGNVDVAWALGASHAYREASRDLRELVDYKPGANGIEGL